jgi:hypothetical protein
MRVAVEQQRRGLADPVRRERLGELRVIHGDPPLTYASGRCGIAGRPRFFHPQLTDLNLSLADQLSSQPHSALARTLASAKAEARGLSLPDYAALYEARSTEVAKLMAILHAPLLAVALLLLHFRRGVHFVDPLAVSLHFWAFALFMIMSVPLLLNLLVRASGLAVPGVLQITLLLLIGLYVWQQLRIAYGQPGWLALDEVGSTAYKTQDHALNLALQNDRNLLELGLGYQDMSKQLFPNQRMDMLDNEQKRVNLSWTRETDRGVLEVRAYYEEDDFWTPSGGDMGPGTFLNINNGQRDRWAASGEWQSQVSQDWLLLIGARYERVNTDAGDVQGYATAPPAMRNQLAEAAAFNALDRAKTDDNIDVTVLALYTHSPTLDIELGAARKTRSPNLYQRYTWSTWAMAAIMNNTVGNGNGYVGDVGLKAETAYKISTTFDWHAADRAWELVATPYFTRVVDYINAVPVGNFVVEQFNVLRYANHRARLYGIDVSAVRNEVKTSGYALVNLRVAHDWKRFRIDVGVENLFDRFYSLPTGGTYLGQGSTMGINTVPWGIAVPGMGRSFFAGVTAKF